MGETAADLFLARLIDWGVDTFFGLPGDGINGFWEALRKRKDEIRYVHVRHEEVGAMAAVGYAKFTGRLGVCLSTAGPARAGSETRQSDARRRRGDGGRARRAGTQARSAGERSSPGRRATAPVSLTLSSSVRSAGHGLSPEFGIADTAGNTF